MRARIVRVVLAAGIGLGAGAFVRALVVRRGETRQLWEYHTVVVRSAAGPATAADTRGEARRLPSGIADTLLNSLGRNGWELVGVTRREVRVEDTLETESLYVFKRPTRTVNR